MTAINSAAGVASQIPITSKNAGRISMAITVNTKVREKASTAEIIPLESAVNIPLAKMLNPTKSNASEQIRFPWTARSKTALPGLAKIDTKGSVTIRETITVATAIVPIIIRLVRINRFNLPWLRSP